MISIRVYRKGIETMIAACDKGLLGRCLEGENRKLDVSRGFYGNGLLGSCDDLVEHLKIATMANLVGEKTIDCAIDAGFVSRENIISVAGVPYAQYVAMI